MELLRRPASSLGESLNKAVRLVDAQTGIIKLLHEAPLAPDAPKIFGCGALSSDFGSLGYPSENEISGSTSLQRAQAVAAAVGEAVERYSAAYVPYDRISYGRASSHPGQIDPESLVLYGDDQYAEPRFAFRRFDPELEIGWIGGRSLSTGKSVLVPAFGVFQPYVSGRGEIPPVQQVTTGLACGNTIEEAVLSGLCEVIERDASMLAWLQSRRLPRLDLEALPEGRTRQTLRRFGRAAEHVVLLDATTDIGVPAYIGVWDGPLRGERRAIFSSCAKLSADMAAAGALRELAQCMMWAESLLDTVSVLPDPEREPITEIEQHVLWPLEPSHRPRFEALLASTQTVRLREELPPRANTPLDHIEVCAARLAHLGLDAIAIDVTSPDIAEVGFHVARVVAPGTQPLFFGSGLHRLSPRALATSENLNLHPHPFP